MFRFLQRFGGESQTRRRGTGPVTRVRRRNHQPNCEALESRQLLSTYYIVNDASGKVLTDTGGSTNGAVIYQYQLYGETNQQWYTVPVSNNSSGNVLYALVNASSGLVLGDPGFSTTNGTGIIQWQWNGGLNEQWAFQGVGNGNFAIVNAASGLVLGDPGFSTSNGTQMIQWQNNGGLNEQWTLLAAGNAPTYTYYVTNAASGLVLGDPGFSTSNGTQIILWQNTGGLNEQWAVVPLADGNYLIVNEASGLVLDSPPGGASTSNPIYVLPVEQYQLNGGLNQQWIFPSLTGDTESVIYNASSGLVLDDPGGSISNGTQLIQDQNNGEDLIPSQIWYLE